MKFSFKHILFIFIPPTVAMLYFTFYFIVTHYETMQKSTAYQQSSQITTQLIEIIRNLQIERGLQAGYLITQKDDALKEKIIQQHEKTNKALKRLKQFLQKYPNTKLLTTKKTNALLQKTFKQLQQRKNMQNKILHKHITRQEEMEFYTQFNKVLINITESYLMVLQAYAKESTSIQYLERLKENAGLERACVYIQILSLKQDKECLQKIFYLQTLQKEEEQKFLLYANESFQKPYMDYLTSQNYLEFTKLRDQFTRNLLKSSDADHWFTVATQRIDTLNRLSQTILLHYQSIFQKYANKAHKELYIAIILSLLSLVSCIIILILLRTMIKKEQAYRNKLKIAAHTFDSHEAITITDANGFIINVNDAFTKITQYTKEETIGQKPSILKSGKHSKEFFKDMWAKLINHGHWSGEIYNKRKNGEIYPERLSITKIQNSKGEITNYVAHFLDISDIVNAKKEAQFQADHDNLTHLYNRKALIEHLSRELTRAQRHSFSEAFLFIDLDHFKAVNDTYGHHIGDKLLQYVARTLVSIVRHEDIVARISGDEFGIILVNINAKNPYQTIEHIAEKIIAHFSQKIKIDDYELSIGASIGARIFPDENDTVELIMQDADKAMYNSKYNGKNRFTFF